MSNLATRSAKKFFREVKSPRDAVKYCWRVVMPVDPHVRQSHSWIWGNLPRHELKQVFPGIEKTEVRILEAYNRALGMTLNIEEVASLLAITLRLNIPVIIGTVLLINPVTIVPVYYLAYRLGTALLNMPPTLFSFEMSWDWLQNGLGPMWKPFLVGCLVCGVVGGVLGYMGLELAWRWRVAMKLRYKTRQRHLAPTAY